jgi:hypothetical protein
LPKNPEDIKWHDLQAHRGSHKNYNIRVEEHLTSLEGKVEFFCRQDKQGELWEKIEETVKVFKQKILKWQVTLRSNAHDERKDARMAAAASHL